MFKKTLILLLVITVTAVAYEAIDATTRYDATGYTQQQKLDRAPNSSDCHAVWHTRANENSGLFTAYWGYYNPPDPWSIEGMPKGDAYDTIWLPETGYPSVLTSSHGVTAFAYLAGAGNLAYGITPADTNANIPPYGYLVVLGAIDEEGENHAVTPPEQWADWREGPPVLAGVELFEGNNLMRIWTGFVEHDVDGAHPQYEGRIHLETFLIKEIGGKPHIEFGNYLDMMFVNDG